MDKTCKTCLYRSDDFTSACVNAESERCADFVDADFICDKWEKARTTTTNLDKIKETLRSYHDGKRDS